MKRAVGGKKNGAAKPPKKAKPGAQKPAAAAKSRGPPWSGHPGWHCRRGRGLIDYIYTAPDGREFTDEASALRAFEGTGVDDSEEEEAAPARRRHNAPAARQPAPAQAPAPTPASAPAAAAAAPGAKKSRRGEGAAAKPAKKPKPAAPKPAAASKPPGQPWLGHPGWHCRRGKGLVDYFYTAPDGEEFTDEPSALAYEEDDNSDDIGLDGSEEDETRHDDPSPAPGQPAAAAAAAAAPAHAPAPAAAAAAPAAAPAPAPAADADPSPAAIAAASKRLESQAGEQQDTEPGAISKTDRLQKGSRVTTPAVTFDPRRGKRWSIATFGDGGTGKLIYGTVTGAVGPGRFQVKWDIKVPQHSPEQTANTTLLPASGGRAFAASQLTRVNPDEGRRPPGTRDETRPDARPILATAPEPDSSPGDELGRNVREVNTTVFRDLDLHVEDDEDDPNFELDADSAEEQDTDDADPTELLLSKEEFDVPLGPAQLPGMDEPEEVVWHFPGLSPAALDGAKLPWLGGQEASAAAEYGWDRDPAERCDPTNDWTGVHDEEYVSTAAPEHVELTQFLMMWPGGVAGMEQQVKRLNETARQHESRWEAVDVWGWLAFLCVLLVKTQHRDTSIAKLFVDPVSGIQSYLFPRASLKKIMPHSRFKELRKYAANAFVGDDPLDPWDPIRKLIVEFNDHNADLLRLGRYTVADESMCPWQPRADKFGGLPHITQIQRKPKEFGPELKSTCTADGLLSYVELQEGAEPMKKKNEKLMKDGYGSKASTAIRLADESSPDSACLLRDFSAVR